MKKTLKFKIDDIKLIEISDSQNALAEVIVCHDGQNRHQMPISLETLKSASPTLINKWLVAGWDGDDFKGHEENQRIIGFFPKENDFKYVYSETEDKTYFVANAIISKIYSDWAFDIFKEENFRDCSMEITLVETEVKEDGYEWITSYIYNGVTILGENYTAACDGANIKITKFSEQELVDIREELSKNFSKIGQGGKVGQISQVSQTDYINRTNQIDNINESKYVKKEGVCVDKEFNKEEYAKNFNITASEMFEILHNVCKNKKYQSVDGDCEFARYYVIDFDRDCVFAYDYKEDKTCAIPYSIEPKGESVELDFESVKPAKQKWVVVESETETKGLLGFAKDILSEEFAKFEKEIEDYKKEISEIKQEKDELEKKFSELEDVSVQNNDASDDSVSDDSVSDDSVDSTDVDSKDDSGVNDTDDISDSQDSVDFTEDCKTDDVSVLKDEKIELEKKFSELESEFDKLKEENESLMNFKNKVKEEERKSKIEFAINSVSDDLSQEQIDEWRGKVDEFNTVEEFDSAIKVFAYENSKSKRGNNDGEDVIRVSLPDTNGDSGDAGIKSIWERI